MKIKQISYFFNFVKNIKRKCSLSSNIIERLRLLDNNFEHQKVPLHTLVCAYRICL